MKTICKCGKGCNYQISTYEKTNKLFNCNNSRNYPETKINHKLKNDLSTEQITPNWFITRGHINGKFCIGYGKTQADSIADAFKDYQVIINLK